jgi:ribonuclease P protein component
LGAAGPASFPKCERIRKRTEYLQVQGRGRKLHSEHFLVFVLPRETPGQTRFGVTVSKKVGMAVERNRVKRLVREVCRRHKAWFPTGIEVVVVAKRAAAPLTFEMVEREMERLCRRSFQAR